MMINKKNQCSMMTVRTIQTCNDCFNLTPQLIIYLVRFSKIYILRCVNVQRLTSFYTNLKGIDILYRLYISERLILKLNSLKYL